MTEKQYHLVLDCDGILTEPGFVYTSEGKRQKHFGCNDSLMLNLFIDEMFVKHKLFKTLTILTGDNGPGGEVSRARLVDMGVGECLVREFKNYQKRAVLKLMFPIKDVFYIADDIYDIPTFDEVHFAATVPSAPDALQHRAQFVSKRMGGHGALTEILWYIMEKHFGFSVVDMIEEKTRAAQPEVFEKFAGLKYLHNWRNEQYPLEYKENSNV